MKPDFGILQTEVKRVQSSQQFTKEMPGLSNNLDSEQK
jgi:hypothetical protein